MKKIVISQSNYIPWKGYFDSIAIADEFVIYDDMQYTRRDWRNRNLIKTPQGLKWLTIPVKVKGRIPPPINEIKIADNTWNIKHWNILKENYKHAKHFKEVKDFIEGLYRKANFSFLSDINIFFLKEISDFLGIKMTYSFSTDLDLKKERSERVLDICLKLHASDLYAGPAIKNYLNYSIFENSGVTINYFNYTGYPEYEQLYSPFEHKVSIIDLIFNKGIEANKFLKC